MAKKSNIETEPQKTESLDEIVERYGRLKAEVDSYEKQIKSDNSSIKSKMTEGVRNAELDCQGCSISF